MGRRPVSVALALSWLSGSLLMTLLIYFYNYYLGGALNLAVIWGIYSVSALVLFFLNRHWEFGLPDFSFKRHRFLVLILSFILIGEITSCFYPVTDWDAVTLYDFRARIMLHTGDIKTALAWVNMPGYPMYTSLLHYWVYANGLWTAMPVYPLFTFSLAAGIYFLFRRFNRPGISALVSLACILAPKVFENSFIAYTNLPYAVFLILGAVYIFFWTRTKYFPDLLMGLIFSLATFWVRLFPFALVSLTLMLLALPLIRKNAKILAVLAFIMFFVICFIPAIRPVAGYLKWAVYQYYLPYTVIFAGLFIYGLFNRRADWYWPLFYTGCSLVLLIGTYIFSRQIPGYYQGIPDAVRRMTIFINLPVIWFAAGLLEKAKP